MPNPVGRPTKYKKSMCDDVIEMMSRGYSLHTVALELDIGMSNMTKWRHKHQEFHAAIQKGIECSQAWWEKLAVDHVVGQRDLDGEKIEFNTALWFINMKNRFKHDWRDKHEVELGGDMTVTIQRFTPENKDGEPWDK